jgi:hypothetical protein
MSECPCGRDRVGCEYHDPTLQPVIEHKPTLASIKADIEELMKDGIVTPEDAWICPFPLFPRLWDD